MNAGTWAIVISGISLIFSVIMIIVSKIYKFGALVNDFNVLKDSFKETKTKVENLHDDMIRVNTVLVLKHKGLENTLSSKHSPRMLNDLGNKLFIDMAGDAFLEKNKTRLFDLIAAKNPPTSLDVENAAQVACYEFINDPAFNPIKDFVYNCPMQKKENGEDFEFTISGACFVLGLKLRDLYLAEHPEILTPTDNSNN